MIQGSVVSSGSSLSGFSINRPAARTRRRFKVDEGSLKESQMTEKQILMQAFNVPEHLTHSEYKGQLYNLYASCNKFI